MPEALKKILDRFLELWNNMEKPQKTRLIVTAAIIAVAVGASLYFVSRPNYVTLVKSSDPKILKDVTTTLDDKGIAYKMGEDGNSILINAADKNKAQIASLDFVQKGMSFDDAFNMIKLNTTESDKEKLWNQYYRNDISSKLMSMANNIEMADVILNIPPKSPFVQADDEQIKPAARVIVKPKSELTAKQVQGIAAMVAGSIAGLSPKDVVVVDDNLNVLNSNSGEEGMGGASSQDEMRIKKAKEIENNIYKLLGGPSDTFDSLKVVANPYLDFDKSESMSKVLALPTGLDPASSTGYVISSQSSTEKATEAANGGIPGTDTNPVAATVPSYPSGTTTGGQYNNKNETINWGYNTSETNQEKAIGKFIPEKSTIAVALYFGRNNKDDAKLTEEYIDKFAQNVSVAAGNIPIKLISVSKFKMSPIVETKIPVDETIKKLINDYGIFAIMLLLIIGLLVAVRPKKKAEEEFEEVSDLAAANAVGGPRFIVPEPEGELPEIDMEERSEVKKQIDKFVKQKPDAVAQLLRNWLSDDWE